jgi:hypothetical protein
MGIGSFFAFLNAPKPSLFELLTIRLVPTAGPVHVAGLKLNRLWINGPKEVEIVKLLLLRACQGQEPILDERMKSVKLDVKYWGFGSHF